VKTNSVSNIAVKVKMKGPVPAYMYMYTHNQRVSSAAESQFVNNCRWVEFNNGYVNVTGSLALTYKVWD